MSGILSEARPGFTYLLHFQVDAPDNQVVGCLLTHQVDVIRQVLLAIIPAVEHACREGCCRSHWKPFCGLDSQLEALCRNLPKCLICFSYFSTKVLCFCSLASSESSSAFSGFVLTMLCDRARGQVGWGKAGVRLGCEGRGRRAHPVHIGGGGVAKCIKVAEAWPRAFGQIRGYGWASLGSTSQSQAQPVPLVALPDSHCQNYSPNLQGWGDGGRTGAVTDRSSPHHQTMLNPRLTTFRSALARVPPC